MTKTRIVSAVLTAIVTAGTGATTGLVTLSPNSIRRATALAPPPGRGFEKPWWEAIRPKDPQTRPNNRAAETFIVPADVLFETNSATIDRVGRGTLTEFAQQHLRDATAIDIFGATDSTGTHTHNLVLSQLRADSAKAVLIDAGISPRIISTHGWADSHPIADEHGPDPMTARARNRRVELVVTLRARRP